MMATFTTDNIDGLQARPLDDLRGWEISFRSRNAGMHHQLYVNGLLADWTDSPERRSFVVGPDETPRELVVAAADAARRSDDFSHLLPPDRRRPAWTYRVAVVRDIRHRRGCRVLLLGDHATGRLDPRGLASCELWPDWAPRWAFGEDAFGRGGFGHDGSQAPGLGKGAFGAGSFGMDTDCAVLAASLPEEGRHQLLLRALMPDGQHAEGDVRTFDSTPPPPPARSLAAVAYDSDTSTLTLELSPDDEGP